MIGIIPKTHPIYLLTIMSGLTAVLVLVCISMPNATSVLQGTVPITNIDNFTNIYTFNTPRAYFQAVMVEQSLVVEYKSVQDIETWPFSIRTNIRSLDEQTSEKYVPEKINVNGLVSQPIYFQKTEFFNVTNLTIDNIVITRNPNIVKLIFNFAYSVPISIPQGFLAYAALPLLVFCVKSPLLIGLVLLYFLSFSTFTVNQSALFYRFFCGYAIFITFRHTTKHSTKASLLCDVLTPAGLVICVIYSLISLIQLGFHCPFTISSSPIDILCGISIVQIIGLVASNQGNLPIFFDFVGAINTIIPYILQILLPVYISAIRACASSYISASILALHGLMCIIISESLLERDDTVSEGVIGVIAREASSSSGQVVEIERGDGLKISKIRDINIFSIMLCFAPSIFSVILLFLAQFSSIPNAEFLIGSP